MDFSYLSPEDQVERLRAMDDPGYEREVRAANAALAEAIESLLSRAKVSPLSPEQTPFSLRELAGTVAAILASFGKPVSQDAQRVEKGIQVRMVSAFARAEYVRLLYS